MRMNRKVALAAGASFGLAFLAACSSESTAPKAIATKASLAVGDVTASVTPAVGKVFVCKTGNAGGDFSFTRQSTGANPDANVAAVLGVGGAPRRQEHGQADQQASHARRNRSHRL